VSQKDRVKKIVGVSKRSLKKIEDSATKIERKLNKLIDKEQPCEIQNPPDDIVDEMVEYENLLWDVIVGLGPKSINKIEVPR
jgi:TPP-dependent 2-oxoacid decarboxylase